MRKSMRVVDAGVELTGYCTPVPSRLAHRVLCLLGKLPFLAMYTYSGLDGPLHDRYEVHMLVKRTLHELSRELVDNTYEKCQADGYMISSQTSVLVSDSWKSPSPLRIYDCLSKYHEEGNSSHR